MISLWYPSESTTSLYLCSTFSYLKVSLLQRARTLKRIFVYLFIQGIYHNSFLYLLHHHFFLFFKFLVENFYQVMNILKCLPSEEIKAPVITTTRHGIVIQFFFPILPYSSSSLYSKNFPKVAYIYYLQFLIL